MIPVPADLLTRDSLSEFWLLARGKKLLCDCTPDTQVLWDAVQPFCWVPESPITRNSRLHRWIVRDGCQLLRKVYGGDTNVDVDILHVRDVPRWVVNPKAGDFVSDTGFYVEVAARDVKQCVSAVSVLAGNYWNGDWGSLPIRSANSSSEMCVRRCRVLASIEPLLPEPTWP